MRTFNVSVLGVLSCVVMIGATPIGNRSLVDPPNALANAPNRVYVALQQFMGGSDPIEILSPVAWLIAWTSQQ